MADVNEFVSIPLLQSPLPDRVKSELASILGKWETWEGGFSSLLSKIPAAPFRRIFNTGILSSY